MRQLSSFAALLLLTVCPALAQSPQPTISGKVSTEREGPLEGVVVGARQTGSTITVSVVSNARSEYRFPAGRLQQGRHEIGIKAAGYDLDGATSVDLTPGQAAVANLELKPTRQLAMQLTSGEWLASAPEADIKRQLLSCTDCHSAQRIFTSRHNADEFLKVFERMGGYYPGASDLQPQRLVGLT